MSGAQRWHIASICGQIFAVSTVMNNFIGDRRISRLPQCDVKKTEYDQIIFFAHVF